MIQNWRGGGSCEFFFLPSPTAVLVASPSLREARPKVLFPNPRNRSVTHSLWDQFPADCGEIPTAQSPDSILIQVLQVPPPDDLEQIDPHGANSEVKVLGSRR